MTGNYLRALKSAVTGRPDTPLVFVCNFEAETSWAEGHVGLPAVQFSNSSRMVHRMEELGVLLAGAADVLLLGQELDPGYVRYLEDLGVELPARVVPAAETVGSTNLSTTELALSSHAVQQRLGAIARAGGCLMPMGTTSAEQKLAEIVGMPLAVPDSDVFERVNGKIFGRRLTQASGLRSVPGYCCETVAELEGALRRGRPPGAAIVVKDSFGVSGKGLLVCTTDKQAEQLLGLVRRRARRTGDDRIEVVVEEWLPKRFDMNYQITVSRSGEVTLDFIKQAVTDRGVHMGHRMPVDLDPRHRRELRIAAQRIGSGLYSNGYWGVAGVDAVMGADDVLYPVLEINARLNMSSYQGEVLERFSRPGQGGLARYHRLRLSAHCPFQRVQDALGDLLRPDDHGNCVIVTGFGTVNASSAVAPRNFDGRLYVIAVAHNQKTLDRLDAETGRRLSTINVQGEGAE